MNGSRLNVSLNSILLTYHACSLKMAMDEKTLPPRFRMVRVDWEHMRKILPERYIVRVHANLLDQHSYPPEERATIPPRGPKAYELTKDKAHMMIPLMPGRPVQAYHGTRGEQEDGFLDSNVNVSVIGEVISSWIDPDNERMMDCEIKLDNQKNASLMWNWAIHFTGAARGVSLNSRADYYNAIPLEVTLIDEGLRPGTGITHVIDPSTGKRIKFELYKLQTDTSSDTPLPPTPTEPIPIPKEPVLIDLEMASQPRDPQTNRFISNEEAAARGIVAPAQVQPISDVARNMQQQMSQYSNPTNTPGTFTKPMAPAPGQQANTVEYNMGQNFAGVPHNNFAGGILHDIGEQDWKKQQQDFAAKQAAAANPTGGFLQTQVGQGKEPERYVPPTPAMVTNVLQQQQTVQAQAQQQQAMSDAHDQEMEELDAWREKATDEEMAKLAESALQKLVSGKHKELTAKEALANAEDSAKSKKKDVEAKKKDEEAQKEKQKLIDQLKEKELDTDNLMSSFMSAIHSLKPQTAAEKQSVQNIPKARNMEQLMAYATPIVSAAGARQADQDARIQAQEQYLQDTNKRQRTSALPRSLTKIADSFAELSTQYATRSEPAYQAPQAVQQQYNTPAPTSSPPVPAYNNTALTYKEQLEQSTRFYNQSAGLRAPDRDLHGAGGGSTALTTAAGAKFGSKRAYSQHEEEAETFYDPNGNTKEDSKWLSRDFVTPELKESYLRAGYKKGFDLQTWDIKKYSPDFYSAQNTMMAGRIAQTAQQQQLLLAQQALMGR